MENRRWRLQAARGLVAAAIVVAALGASVASAQMKVGVVTSATGPTAFVGIPQKNAVALLPRRIGDVDVEYAYFDDASDPGQTVQIFRKLLGEQKVDAIIGPSGSPNGIAVVPLVAEASTPLLAPVGTPAVVLPMDDRKRWVFKTTQNDDLIAEALVGHMAKTGVKTVGIIGLNDPYGDSWNRAFVPLAEAAGLKIVDNERFARTDQSVTGQAIRLVAANPDAILVAAAGGPTVLPHVSLVEHGYKGRIYQTHGAATPDFIRLGGASVEGAIMAASPILVLDQVGAGVASRKVAEEFIAAYRKEYGASPATFAANVYDAGLMLQRAVPDALKKGRPGSLEFRAALRDALEATRDLVGTQGVYNLTPQDHSGFDARGRVLMQLKGGRWVLLAD